MNTRTLIATLGLGLLAAGCGGGGGGAPATPPVSDYLFYVDNGALVAVNAADGSTTTIEPDGVSGAEVIGEAGVENEFLTGLRARYVAYARNGMLYYVPTRAAGAPQPVRFSSESQATQVCQARGTLTDTTAPERGAYIYVLPGPDGDCNTKGDNLLRLATLDMGESEDPRQGGGTGLMEFRTVHALQGDAAILGTVVYRTSDQVRALHLLNDADYLLADSVTDGQLLATSALGEILLRVNDAVGNRVYRHPVVFAPATPLDGATAVTGLLGNATVVDAVGGGIEFYFVRSDDTTIIWLSVNTNFASPLVNANTVSFEQLALGGKWVHAVGDTGTQNVAWGIDPANPNLMNVTTFVPNTVPLNIVAVGPGGDVYLNAGSNLNNGAAHLGRPGVPAQEFPNALWTGFVNGSEPGLPSLLDGNPTLLGKPGGDDLAGLARYVILSRQGMGPGAVVEVYDAASGNGIVVSSSTADTLPAFYTSGLAAGGKVLGTGGLLGGDVALLDPAADDSLVELTSGAGATVVGGCTTGTGGFDPVLPLLLAAAAAGMIRRRRAA